jgi:serine/threonine protein kinase
MYQKIISAKLTFPEYLSAEAKAVLTGLLQRDPKRRLGSNGDAEEIRKHPFFLPIDFDALNRREIQPPYKPPVSDGKMDLTNVDEEFKSETVKDTPAPAASKIQQPVNFPNFTYVAPKGTVLQDSLLDDKNGKAGEKATDSGSDSEA